MHHGNAKSATIPDMSETEVEQREKEKRRPVHLQSTLREGRSNIFPANIFNKLFLNWTLNAPWRPCRPKTSYHIWTFLWNLLGSILKPTKLSFPGMKTWRAHKKLPPTNWLPEGEINNSMWVSNKRSHCFWDASFMFLTLWVCQTPANRQQGRKTQLTSYLTSSFAAVILTMATRGRCQTQKKQIFSSARYKIAAVCVTS